MFHDPRSSGHFIPGQALNKTPDASERRASYQAKHLARRERVAEANGTMEFGTGDDGPVPVVNLETQTVVQSSLPDAQPDRLVSPSLSPAASNPNLAALETQKETLTSEKNSEPEQDNKSMYKDGSYWKHLGLS